MPEVKVTKKELLAVMENAEKVLKKGGWTRNRYGPKVFDNVPHCAVGAVHCAAYQVAHQAIDDDDFDPFQADLKCSQLFAKSVKTLAACVPDDALGIFAAHFILRSHPQDRITAANDRLAIRSGKKTVLTWFQCAKDSLAPKPRK